MKQKTKTYTITYDEIIKHNKFVWLLLIRDRRVYLSKYQCKVDRKKKTVTIPGWLVVKARLTEYI